MTAFQNSMFGVRREKNLHIFSCITHTFLPKFFEGKLGCALYVFNFIYAYVLIV